MGSSRRLVVGLTGSFGSGCTKIADQLGDPEKYGWRKYSLSQAMRELAPQYIEDLDEEKLKSPVYRWYQQDVGNEIRRKKIFAMAESVVQKVREGDEREPGLSSKNIVIDGIRNPNEIIYLRDNSPHFFVVAVFAPFDIRWIRKKKEYNENQGYFRRDDARDSGELEPPWGQKVQLCLDRSDILIGNSIQFDEPWIEEQFWKKLEYYIELMENPGRWGPRPHELNMALAYEVSLMSTCCKRKVGAALVREEVGPPPRSYVISTGYNEVPRSIRSCLERGGKSNPEYCVKDDKAKKFLQEHYKVCPICGSELSLNYDFSVPILCPNSNCRARLPHDFTPGRMLDLCIAVHAEEAAILQAAKFAGTEVEGSVLYTTTFPCALCANKIVHAGIKKVYFAEPYPEDEATNVLDEAGIEVELFEGVKGRAYHRLYEPQPTK